jgi:hypothetical protein
MAWEDECSPIGVLRERFERALAADPLDAEALSELKRIERIEAGIKSGYQGSPPN